MTNERLFDQPDVAWEPYEPSSMSPWDFRRAAHLFRRAEFGGSIARIEQALEGTPQSAVAQIVADAQASTSQSEFDALETSVIATGSAEQLAAAWIYRMLFTRTPLLETMTLHWHSHFATSDAKVHNAALMLQQNGLIRRHALGSFRQLVHEIARDPAMLIYLDSAINRKAHPNENFARELMELFCLGEGHYTERDIQELARCFTGWEVRDDRFRFNRFQHDRQEKMLFGSVGAWDGDEAIDVLLRQPTAPQFVAMKLIQWLVMDEPSATKELATPVAKWIVDADWQMGPVVEKILSSRLFFSDDVMGRKIRSPIDLAVGLLRSLEAKTDTKRLADQLQRIGQGVYYPPNVKGWEGGRRWIDSTSILGRVNMVRQTLSHETTRFDGALLGDWFQSRGVHDATSLVERCEQLLCAVPLPAPARTTLIAAAGEYAEDKNRQAIEVIGMISTLPEFQLG